MLDKNSQFPQGQRIIVRKQAPAQQTATPAIKERKSRYGKRFLTIRGKSIVADYLRNDTATMYVIEDGTKALLLVATEVPRAKARETAMQIARLIEAYEGIARNGRMSLELTTTR